MSNLINTTVKAVEILSYRYAEYMLRMVQLYKTNGPLYYWTRRQEHTLQILSIYFM